MVEAIWVWATLGLILIAVEIIAIGSLYALWFGVAALLVALVLWLFPGTLITVQLLMFAILSAGSLAIWRRYYKKTDTDARVGQSEGEEIGRIGTVTKTTGPLKTGTIHFTQGLMGSREWVAVSNDVIEAGSNAQVTAVEGNTLRISKIS